MPLLIDNETNPVDQSTTEFPLAGPAIISCEGLEYDEHITVLVKTPSGGWQPMTSRGKTVLLSKMNNTELLSGPRVYALQKDETKNPVSADYTE